LAIPPGGSEIFDIPAPKCRYSRPRCGSDVRELLRRLFTGEQIFAKETSPHRADSADLKAISIGITPAAGLMQMLPAQGY